MRSGRLAPTATAVTTAAVLALGACGVPTDESASVIDDEKVPFRLLEPSTTTTTLPPTTTIPVPERPAALCFAKRKRLTVVRRDVPLDADAEAVVRLLLAGPTEAEAREGLRAPLTASDAVRSVTVSGGVARVDLGPGFETVTGPEQLLAFAQLVCTLTAQPGVGQVVFTLGGSPVEVPRGDGSLTADPVSRDDYATLIR